MTTSTILYIRSSGICLFLTAYFSLFLIASVILFTPFFKTNFEPKPVVNLEPNDFPADYDFINDYQWENTLFLNKSKINILQHTRTGLRWPTGQAGLINCSSLQEVTDLEFVAAGWTKAVYKGKFRGQPVAIKTVNLNGHEFGMCQQRQPETPFSSCYRRAAAKILKELILLTELNHENIVKVLGSCVPDAVGPVVVVTELGEPLDTVQLLQLSWEHRLRLALGVARILHHLAHSPLGSLAMNDLRRQQFVLVDGVLKLSDVDDMGISEPICHTSADCSLHKVYNTTEIPSVNCIHGLCDGYNERLNIWRAGQHFIRQFLPLRAPSSLEPQIQLLLDAYSGVNLWNTQDILSATESLLSTYSTRETLDSGNDDYRKYSDSDLPDTLDYTCSQSESRSGCVHTVNSQYQAVELCNKDIQCQAIVVAPHSVWPGHIRVVFKKGFTTPTMKMGYYLLLKPR
uniref:Protein kinase domain-containing protein n=1 Tax=Clastoptera arizonana TaxID=38151 RepID=A0A1B6BWV1_9HEMI